MRDSSSLPPDSGNPSGASSSPQGGASNAPTSSGAGASSLVPVLPFANVPAVPAAPSVPAVGSVTAIQSADRTAWQSMSPTSAKWEHLWFSLIARPNWASLAIVPSEPGMDTLAIARKLASVGHAYLEQPVLLVDATRVTPNEVAARLRTSAERTAAGARVIVATGSPMERAACIAVVRGVDAAVLLVQAGETDLAQARKTLDLIGNTQFLGAITIEE